MNDDHLIASRSLATRLADADEAYIRSGHVPLADVVGARDAALRAPFLLRAGRHRGEQAWSATPPRARSAGVPPLCAIRAPFATPPRGPKSVDAEIHL